MRNVNFKIATAVSLLALTGVAHAGLSSTWTATSDYDFRGLTQSDEDPALQASIDFATESGWYVGAWASNVEFSPASDADYEVDLYTGFAGTSEGGLGWDVGALYYSYPEDSDINFPEIYGGISYGVLKAKLWYSNDFGASDEDGTYIEGNAALPLADSGVTVNLHAGYSSGKGVKAVVGEDYMDYSFGLAYEIQHCTASVKYVKTNLSQSSPYDDERIIFSIATTFPWSK